MAKARRKVRTQVAQRKRAGRRPRRTITTTTTTRIVKSNPRRRRNSEGNWPRNRPPGWSPEAVARWRRSSEAALHRQWKLEQAIKRRRAVYQKKHGRPGPGEMPEQLAARHAAYRRAQTAKIRRTIREEREEARERRKARRGNPMAKRKRTPAQKAAFRRMIAGLKAHKARKNPGRKKRRRGRARRRKTTSVSVRINPRRKRRKNSRGGSIMAKRRRRSRTNPGRRHHRRRNPHRRHHRRRNPGGGGMVSIVKSTISAAIPSMATGGLMALVDSKVFKDKAMPVQVLGKLGLAAGAGYFLRGRPKTACLVMGAIMGGVAYQLVAQASGGVVAPDKPAAAKAMAALVYADRRMAALVNSNGTLRTQPTLSGMGQGMGDGGTALPTMPIYDPVNLG